MDDKQLVRDLNNTIANWINNLEKYSSTQFLAKPSANSWSVGQVYMHIISATIYFIKQVNICVANNDNADMECSPSAKAMFANNEFPDAVLDGPPGNAFTPQPVDKADVLKRLEALKNKISKTGAAITANAFKGKTKHLGLGYFNAVQWFQFAEMHLRHHERQRSRLDAFLKENNI